MKARTNGVILNKKDRTNKKNARVVAVEKALSEIIAIVNDKLFVFQLSDVMKCCSKTCLPNLSIGSLIVLFGKIFMRNLIDTNKYIQRIVQDTNQQISFDEMTEILTRLKNKIVENWCVVEPSLIVAKNPVQVPNNYRY